MKIAVLSRNADLYSTRRLLEEGRELGHKMHVIDHLKCNIEIDERGPSLYYGDHYLENFEAVIPRVGASVTFYGTAVVRQFEMMSIFTVASSRGIVHSRDKLRCLQLLSNVGVGLPKTIFTNYSKNVEHVVESAGGVPVALKLLEGSQGLGLVMAQNEKAAQSVLEAFNGLKARVIVQEFIKEANGEDIRAFVIDGEVVGAIKRKIKPAKVGAKNKRRKTFKKVALTEKEKDTAIRAAKALGLAIAGVDLIQSSRGPLVLEINSSPGLAEIEKTTGANIAKKIIQYIERNVESKNS